MLDDATMERFRSYCGTDPCPEDFDEFWCARVAEADTVPLSYHVERVPFETGAGLDAYDLWFTGMEGAQIHAKYLRPHTDEDVPLVLQFHGYPGASRSWFEQCSFVGMGMALIALDCPGQGGPSQDPGGFAGSTVAGHIIAGLDGPLENLYYVRLHQDIRILCNIVAQIEGIDATRVYVNGASQGGALALATCALNPGLIRRAAVLYPFLSDFRMVWELGLDVVAYEGIGYFSRWFAPAGERLDEAFGKLAYFDTKNFARLVRCPVLMGTGLADTVVPPATQFAVYNNLTCEKEHHLYPGFAHVEIQEFDDLIIPFLCERGEGSC